MSVFSLKLLALITMFIDHIGEFFPKIPHVVILRQIGRISAPLFLLGTGYGIRYTSSPKKYLTRLYILSAAMGIGNGILIHFFQDSEVFLSNNFPSTIFLISCLGFLSEIYESNPDEFKKYSLIFLISQIISLAVFYIFINELTPASAEALSGILPNIFHCEGGFFFVALGFVIFKFCTDKKALFSTYIFCCLIYLAAQIHYMISENIPFYFLFTRDVGWMMIFASAFMLLCNGKKGYCGKYTKYIFYFFYPLHIWGLFLLSNIK